MSKREELLQERARIKNITFYWRYAGQLSETEKKLLDMADQRLLEIDKELRELEKESNS